MHSDSAWMPHGYTRGIHDIYWGADAAESEGGRGGEYVKGHQLGVEHIGGGLLLGLDVLQTLEIRLFVFPRGVVVGRACAMHPPHQRA